MLVVHHGDARIPQVVIECLIFGYSNAQPERIAIFSSFHFFHLTPAPPTGGRSLILPPGPFISYITLVSFSPRQELVFEYTFNSRPILHTCFIKSDRFSRAFNPSRAARTL